MQISIIIYTNFYIRINIHVNIHIKPYYPKWGAVPRIATWSNCNNAILHPLSTSFNIHHIHIHTYIHISIHIYTYTYTHSHLYIYIYIVNYHPIWGAVPNIATWSNCNKAILQPMAISFKGQDWSLASWRITCQSQ